MRTPLVQANRRQCILEVPLVIIVLSVSVYEVSVFPVRDASASENTCLRVSLRLFLAQHNAMERSVTVAIVARFARAQDAPRPFHMLNGFVLSLLCRNTPPGLRRISPPYSPLGDRTQADSSPFFLE